MCEHGDTVEIEIIQCIRVDRCIAEEIRWLNAQGVRTEGCCCGHGKAPATAMIAPGSAERATALGYEPVYKADVGLWEIRLKKGEGGR